METTTEQEPQAGPRNLIQHTAIYLPDAESRLRDAHGDGSFASGEGAVGRAAESRLPTFEHEENGWTTVAIPCVQGTECRGVVTLGGEAGDDLRGAFELWRRNDRGELAMTEAWYANLERLEQITPYVKFPKRAGLPGRIWDDRFPRVLGALSDSKNFVRVATARAEQLSAALGVPFMHAPPELDGVLLVLNTKTTPIAGAMEVWARDLQTQRYKIVSADYGANAALASASRGVTHGPGEGIVGHVVRDTAPWMTTDLLGVEYTRGERFAEYGFKTGLGLPVFIGGDLVACVNFYL